MHALLTKVYLQSASNSRSFTLMWIAPLFVQKLFDIFHNLSIQTYGKLERSIPGFSTVMEKVQRDFEAKEARRLGKREALKRAEQDKALFGRPL